MVNDPSATQDGKEKVPKEPAIKFRASTAGMKSLVSGEIHLVLSADKAYIHQIMALLNIEQSGDSIAFTAVRVKAPKVKIVENAEKKPVGKKIKGAAATPIKTELVEVLTGTGENGESLTVQISPEEDLFITYLLQENMNRTQAYMRVFPKSTQDSARASASRMLAKVNVKAAMIARLNEEAMSAEEGVMWLSRVARGTVVPFLKEGPDGFMYFDLSHPDAKENMHLIKEMETKRERRIEGTGEVAEEWEGEWVKVKLYDAHAARVDLLKIHGMFTKKIDLTSGGKPLPEVDHAGFDRSLSTFLDAIKSIAIKESADKKTGE